MLVPCLVRFDVRFETFDFLTQLPEEVQRSFPYLTLINYQGKLASPKRTDRVSLVIFILEDFNKQKWLKVSLHVLNPSTYRNFNIKGIAQTGEIIYAPYCLDGYFFILHDVKVVELEVDSPEDAFGPFSGVVSFLDYVETVMLS